MIVYECPWEHGLANDANGDGNVPTEAFAGGSEGKGLAGAPNLTAGVWRDEINLALA